MLFARSIPTVVISSMDGAASMMFNDSHRSTYTDSLVSAVHTISTCGIRAMAAIRKTAKFLPLAHGG